MKRIVTLLFLLIVVSSLYGQRNKEKLELSRDAFGEFNFDASSIVLSKAGSEELAKFSKWYISNSRELYHVYLHGIETKLELEEDPFIGVKRCKIVMDSLAKRGVNISMFFITNDRIHESNNRSGVSFIIDTEGMVLTESDNEQDYFKENKIKAAEKIIKRTSVDYIIFN